MHVRARVRAVGTCVGVGCLPTPPRTSLNLLALTLSAFGQTCLLAALALDAILLGSHPRMHDLRSAFIPLPLSGSRPAAASAPNRRNSWYRRLMASKEVEAVLAGPGGAAGDGGLGSPDGGGDDRDHGGSGKSW